jgi:hypothetical protein
VLPINLASLVVFHRNLVCYITPNSFWIVVVTWPDVRPLKGIDCCFCFWVADIYHSTIQVSFLFNVFRRRLVDNSCQRLSTTFLSRKISALYSNIVKNLIYSIKHQIHIIFCFFFNYYYFEVILSTKLKERIKKKGELDHLRIKGSPLTKVIKIVI